MNEQIIFFEVHYILDQVYWLIKWRIERLKKQYDINSWDLLDILEAVFDGIQIKVKPKLLDEYYLIAEEEGK